MKTKNLIVTLGLGICLAAGCAGSNANTAGTAAGTAAGAAAGQTGQSLGISDSLIQVATDAAKAYLAKSPTQEAADKEAAAKAGVDAAAEKAKAEGQELKPEQQTGLMNMLKGIL